MKTTLLITINLITINLLNNKSDNTLLMIILDDDEDIFVPPEKIKPMHDNKVKKEV